MCTLVPETILKSVSMEKMELLHILLDAVDYLWLPLNEVSAPRHTPIGLVVTLLNIVFWAGQTEAIAYLQNSTFWILYIIFNMNLNYR